MLTGASTTSTSIVVLERPICQQCAFGNRHYECQWDPAPLSKTEKLEARVRELEDLVEFKYGRQPPSDSSDSRATVQNGKLPRIRITELEMKCWNIVDYAGIPPSNEILEHL